ncbi:hypothetical protein DFH08DRAFT_814425 [Mycena albidolilacea]|uniref:Uncharacterized protein n=1 Tax=Mycena albidolilacea TaxID=1033008 RepID=A0AAD6ZP87_9AGAR|nr:hypothetical protein DFH08DRAFT_814425 [Mycena albidolilacea]
MHYQLQYISPGSEFNPTMLGYGKNYAASWCHRIKPMPFGVGGIRNNVVSVLEYCDGWHNMRNNNSRTWQYIHTCHRKPGAPGDLRHVATGGNRQEIRHKRLKENKMKSPSEGLLPRTIGCLSWGVELRCEMRDMDVDKVETDTQMTSHHCIRLLRSSHSEKLNKCEPGEGGMLNNLLAPTRARLAHQARKRNISFQVTPEKQGENERLGLRRLHTR